jgi:hypothetical protein
MGKTSGELESENDSNEIESHRGDWNTRKKSAVPTDYPVLYALPGTASLG